MMAHVGRDDLLWQHLKTVPAFRALLRAVEARFFRAVDLPEPILDLGCGDGHFGSLAIPGPIAAGLDPWWGPLTKAHRLGHYQTTVQALGDQIPYPDGHFGTVVSNSVLEHIPNLQPVLAEANRVLRPEGRLIITMPSHLFTEYLGGAALFTRLRLLGLADNYRYLFNRISRHAHTDPPELWAERLALAGFTVERWQYYFSRSALRALELGHVQGLPAAIMHALTGWWVVAPWPSSLALTERWVRPFYEEPFPRQGAYLFFLARKSGRPMPAGTTFSITLPPPRPFSMQELDHADGRLAKGMALEPAPDAAPALPQGQRITVTSRPDLATEAVANQAQSPLRDQRNPAVSGLLIVTALMAAVLAQSILNRTPASPRGGLFWYGVSLVALALFSWRRRRARWLAIDWQKLTAIPAQRWLYLPGLFLVILAGRQANSATLPNPTLALLLWLAGIGVALLALWPRQSAAAHSSGPIGASRPIWLRNDSLGLILLLLAALNVRLINLVGHPFILSGTEANIGLEVLRVIEGGMRSPFSTGWLTNPTLPFFILSLPIRLLGPSTLSIRILSPLIGAVTVVAVALIGRRLWNRDTGVVAAILLLGSHFHLHFSRLGMTNNWDPLLALLGLGLLGIAWRDNRPMTWLLAGVGLGLNAYSFGGARLLPLMLVALTAWACLEFLVGSRTRRQEALMAVRQRWSGLLTASLMTCIVAWPQLAYFNTNPGAFMERANVLGIFQSGWLRQEAAVTGQSEITLLWEQLKKGMLAFHYSLDVGPSYNPGRPLLGFWPAILSMFGFVMVLRRLRTFAHRIVVVWLAVTIIFGGALLQGVPNSHRLLIALPALALLSALPLVRGSRWLAAASPPIRARRRLILFSAAAFIAVLDLAFYFGPYQSQPRFADRNTEAAHQIADYLNTREEGWAAYFYGPPSMYISFPNIPFLAKEFRAGENLWDVVDSMATLPQPTAPSLAFIFLPERLDELGSVQAVYPGGTVRQVEGVYANPLFYVYEVDR